MGSPESGNRPEAGKVQLDGESKVLGSFREIPNQILCVCECAMHEERKKNIVVDLLSKIIV